MSLDITIRCAGCGRELSSNLVYVRSALGPGDHTAGVCLDVALCGQCKADATLEAVKAVARAARRTR